MIYLDITDILDYAQSNIRISGIQRVQLRIISSLVGRLGPDRVRCSFWHPTRREVVSFDPSGVFDGHRFELSHLLARLGLLSFGWKPVRHELRNALARYPSGSLSRGMHKLKIHLVALLAPGRLHELGVTHRNRFRSEPLLPLAKLGALPQRDVYILLGSNWYCEEILEFGKQHVDAGGIVVQMIYDLIPHLAPQYCGQHATETFRAFLERTYRYANRFTCISDCSRREFLDYLASQGVTREAVTVPLAHEFDGYPRNSVLARAESADARVLEGRPFVLCVGTIEPRKNGAGLLRAWERLLAERDPQALPALVFAGKLLTSSTEFIERLNANPLLRQSVVLLPAPTDADLAFLYSQAMFSVFPSKYEGWGLPVGEAAWFGKYAISSYASSLPEVCGDLIDYVNPDDPDDIARALAHALDNPAYIAARESRIREAPLRSWDEVADRLLAVAEA